MKIVATDKLIKKHKATDCDNFILLNGIQQYADKSLPLCSSEETIFLKIETKLKRPVLITHLTSNSAEGKYIKPTIRIKTLPGAKAVVIERFIHTGRIKNNYKAMPITVIELEENSTLEHVKIQDECLKSEHFGTVKATVLKGADLKLFSLTLGGKKAENRVNVETAGENGNADIYGLYFAKTDQRTENYVTINHSSRETTSSQLFKGVLGDRAKGSFIGKIQVRKHAIKVNAKQLSSVLLLSDDASCIAKPELEIDADDVKCTHGATVGQISTDELFYLTSRGIKKEAAMKLLYLAYTKEVVDLINNSSARTLCEQYIDRIYDKRIKQSTKVCR